MRHEDQIIAIGMLRFPDNRRVHQGPERSDAGPAAVRKREKISESKSAPAVAGAGFFDAI